MKKLPVLIAVLFLTLPLIAQAQLTSSDLDSLRAVAASEGWEFEITANPATQYSLEQLTGLVEPPDWQEKARWVAFDEKMVLPDAFDWRNEVAGGLPSVKNQGGCGSCWAFATVGALECNIKIIDGIEEDLSEQYLLNCNRDGWDCGGGWWAHDYHQWKDDACDSVGAVLEAELGYVAYETACACPYTHPYTINDWAYIGSPGGVPSTQALKQAIYTYGPISVAVSASGAMQAYGGGIFTGCSSSDINHGVVLVGWDDNQSGGIWIMRNSWGSGWGEGGYMRMPYGCAYIGYGATYVNYFGGAYLRADTCIGWAPFDVQFEGLSGLEVDTWCWDFGDGDSAWTQHPFHCFETPGLYDIKVEIEAGTDTRSRTRYGYIAALADTMYASEVSVDPEVNVVEVTVYAVNNAPIRDFRIPVEYSGSLDLVYDSFSTVGCRTEYFEEAAQINWVPSKLMTFKLTSSLYNTSPDLDAGSGPILKMYFHISGGTYVGQQANIVLDGYSPMYMPTFTSPMGVYEPKTQSGSAAFTGCCVGMTGNINGDQDDQIDVSDLVFLVAYMFNQGEEPPCLPEASVDGDIWGSIDVSDLVYLVAYMFNSGPDPHNCF